MSTKPQVIRLSVESLLRLSKEALDKHWPSLENGDRWITSQILAESNGNPKATSKSGAMGLMQLMPKTAAEMGLKVEDILSIEPNIDAGVRYLSKMYNNLTEISDHENRLLWAFASYNCGQAYVKKALKLCSQDGELLWANWYVGKYWLMNRECKFNGLFPYYLQTWNYIEMIQDNYKRIEEDIKVKDNEV